MGERSEGGEVRKERAEDFIEAKEGIGRQHYRQTHNNNSSFFVLEKEGGEQWGGCLGTFYRKMYSVVRISIRMLPYNV